MALFYKRPLACACACLIVTIFTLYFAPISVCLLIGGVFVLVSLFLLFLCLVRGFSYPKLFLLLIVLAISIGGFRTYLDQKNGVKGNILPMGEVFQSELSIKEIVYQNTYGAEYLVHVERLGEYDTSYTAMLRIESSAPFGVGDNIQGSFLLESLDYDAYSDNAATNYFSQGAKFLLVCEDAQALTLLESGTHTLSAKLSRIRAIAAFRISSAVGGEEGKLLAAILLGTKNDLADSTVRDFRLSGVSHLLALSGLHLMILVGLTDLLLRLLRTSKRTRIAIVIPLCLFYLLLTGCNYSLMRAMLMLGAVYLSFLLREDNDPPTALFLSAAIILVVTPYAVFSLSFQMTILATLGILAYAKFQTAILKLFPKGKGKLRFLRSVIRALLSSFLITITSALCLLPVIWLTFGSYALLTPFANLLMVPIAPFLLFGAILALLLPLAPIGAMIAPIAKFALLLSRIFASFDMMISLRAAYVPYILIPLILISALLLVLNLKHRYFLSLVPLVLAILAFAIAVPIAHRLGEEKLTLTYRQSGKNEGLILVQNSGAMICDASGASLTQWRADWYTAQQLGATRLEVLMLTHYHSKSVVALSRFSQSVYIHALWLPQPQNDSEKEILSDLLEIAIEKGLSVTIYEHETPLTVFETGEIRLQKPLWHSRSTEPAFSLRVSFGQEVICYHTAALSEYLRAKKQSHVCDATHLILGAHGPVPHGTVEVSDYTGLCDVIVSNETILSFLHVREGIRYLISPNERRYVLK